MSDTFRREQRQLTAAEVGHISRLKSKAEELEALFNVRLPNRAQAIAKTKLEEAVMWAVKGLTE